MRNHALIAVVRTSTHNSFIRAAMAAELAGFTHGESEGEETEGERVVAGAVGTRGEDAKREVDEIDVEIVS
jgi:hypothetical protein